MLIDRHISADDGSILKKFCIITRTIVRQRLSNVSLATLTYGRVTYSKRCDHMKMFNVCVIWLKTVSVLFSAFGIVIALFNQTHIFQVLFSDQINAIFWRAATLPPEFSLFQQWIYGLLGATCLMVGILIFFVIHNAYAKKEKWAWYCLLFALVAWFLVDESISLYFQVYFNAVFNLILLAAVLIPMGLSYRDFKQTTTIR